MKKYEKILTSILSLIIIFCGIVDNYSVNKVKAEIKIGAENYQDYHVMRRRYKDGAFWAHKPGCVSSVLIYNGDPITAKTWNGDEYDGGWGDTTYRYTSSICLIAYR